MDGRRLSCAALTHEMNIVIGPSRWRHVMLLLGSLAFVAGGVFILGMPPSRGESVQEQQTIGWGCIIFFGGCGLVGVWQLIDLRPRLIIDDDGIYDRTLGVGRIPWEEIQGAYLLTVSGHDFICLELLDADRYLQRTNPVKRALAGAKTALGFAPISLNLSCVAADSRDILELILKRIHLPGENWLTETGGALLGLAAACLPAIT